MDDVFNDLDACQCLLCSSQDEQEDEQEQDTLLRYLAGLENFINEEIETA